MNPDTQTKIIDILNKWNISISLQDILIYWNQPNRFYHTEENHLIPMIAEILDNNFDEETNEIMIISALFHDIIYDPKQFDNESNSIKLLESVCKCENIEDRRKLEIVYDIINMTKNHVPKGRLQEFFAHFDLKILTEDFDKIMDWEKLIYKEFEWVNWKDYKIKRIKILRKLINQEYRHVNVNKQGILNLINVIENKVPNICIFCGSFNPFTIGHKNIVDKAEKIFDKVIIAKGRSDSKKIDEVEFEREFNNIKLLYPCKEVITYSGLITDVLRAQEGKITLIRGIRNGNDLDAENTLIRVITDIYPELNVVYIPSDIEYNHISSTLVRNMKKYGDEYIRQYLP